MSEFKCPKRLAVFLMAIGKKLNGDQLRECIEQARDEARYTDPSLNTAETRVAQWIMDDDGMAERYVEEHRAGLEALNNKRCQCQYALERLTGSDYSIERELQYIKRNADDALKYIEQIKRAAELKVEQ